MRIAQVSPLYERVPPVAYGGTERVVSYLTEELVQRGHEVTLFASGDSLTTARLFPACRAGLRMGSKVADPIPPHLSMIDEVFHHADQFDIIHFHTEYLHLALAGRASLPCLTTLHGRLDTEGIHGYFLRYAHLPWVSISNAQRAPMPWLRWVGTVYHGLPRDLHTPVAEPGNYLAFLGRLSPEKGCEAAVQIAERAGMPLRIAGKIADGERPYVNAHIVPLLEREGVEYVGEIGGRVKDAFLGRAYAVLFPIDWPEPFGLVMIEALATGTPVIAFRRGSVPEVIDDGVTGFVVNTVDEAVRALARVPQLDRRRIRRVFEERFSVERMTDDYLAIYQSLTHVRDQHFHGIAGSGVPRAAFRAPGS